MAVSTDIFTMGADCIVRSRIILPGSRNRRMACEWPASGLRVACAWSVHGEVVANETFHFIEQALEAAESVLIHSVRGQSRSCCVLAAYMMKKYSWGLRKTMEFLSSRRPDLELKPSFLQQLLSFERRVMQQSKQPFSLDWNDNNFRGLECEELLLRNTYMNSQMGPLAEIQLEAPNGASKPTRLAWNDGGVDDRLRLEKPAGAAETNTVVTQDALLYMCVCMCTQTADMVAGEVWDRDAEGRFGPRGRWWFHDVSGIHGRPGGWYFRDGQGGVQAAEEWQEQVEESTYAYVLALEACARASHWERAVELLSKMRGRGLGSPPCGEAFAAAIGSTCGSGRWAVALSLLADLESQAAGVGASDPESLAQALAKALACAAQGRRQDVALGLLERLRQLGRGAASAQAYADSIEACGRAGGRWEEALALMSRMRAEGLEPTEDAYLAMLSCCGPQGRWREALQILFEIRRSGGHPRNFAFARAIEACGVAGQWEISLRLLSQAQGLTAAGRGSSFSIKGRSCSRACFSMAILACEVPGRWEQALRLLQDMKSSGGFEPALSEVGAAFAACEAAGADLAADALAERAAEAAARFSRSAGQAEANWRLYDVKKASQLWEYIQRNAEPGDLDGVIAAVEEHFSKVKWTKVTGSARCAVLERIVAESDLPGVRRVLECGGFVGHSALCFARALRRRWEGVGHHEKNEWRVWSLEQHPLVARVARQILKYAGVLAPSKFRAAADNLVGSGVQVIVGRSEAGIKVLARQHAGLVPTIDLMYLDHAQWRYHLDVELARSGGLLRRGSIVVGNNCLFPGRPLFIGYGLASSRAGLCHFELVPLRVEDLVEDYREERSQLRVQLEDWLGVCILSKGCDEEDGQIEATTTTKTKPKATTITTAALRPAPEFWGLAEEVQRVQRSSQSGPVDWEAHAARIRTSLGTLLQSLGVEPKKSSRWLQCAEKGGCSGVHSQVDYAKDMRQEQFELLLGMEDGLFMT
ncbi:unnamed protein product [Polarella glacialis]|uniref:Tyrosine-protein phosphatase domain-containing protein n=1 Tax=Polarella glacialis TaxID=89957 RepID=A0A813EQK2_POLGL|nr:unnamed protein product [Polarella glacialis]